MYFYDFEIGVSCYYIVVKNWEFFKCMQILYALVFLEILYATLNSYSLINLAEVTPLSLTILIK